MYQDHFGFYTAPFSLAPSLKFLYASQAFEETMAHLVYGLEGGEDFILITGETGAGKTLALNNLTAHLSGTYRVALVNVTQVNFAELLKMLLGELGRQAPPGADRADLLLLLKQEVEAARREGRRLLLIVDEAQNLDSATLEGLRLLVNLGPADEQVIQVILSGQPRLLLRLREPDLVQLRQRIRVHYHLAPLDRKEVGEYIRHRVRVAGCEQDVFTPEAIRLIAEHSGGVPRLVNILADKALLAAYVDGADRVKAAHVEIPEDLPRTTPEQRRVAALAAEAAEQLAPAAVPVAPEPEGEETAAPGPAEATPAPSREPAPPAPPVARAGPAPADTPPSAGSEGTPPAKDEVPPPAGGRPAPTGPETESGEEPLPPLARRRRRSRGGWFLALAVVAVAAVVLIRWTRRERSDAASRPERNHTAVTGRVQPTGIAPPETRPSLAGGVTADTGTTLVAAAAETEGIEPAPPASAAGGAVAPAGREDMAPEERTRVQERRPASSSGGTSSPVTGTPAAPAAAVAESATAAGMASALPDTVEPGLYVLVGSFRDVSRAVLLAGRVRSLSLPVVLMRKQIREKTWVRVLTGPWPDATAAREAERALREGKIRDSLLMIRIRS